MTAPPCGAAAAFSVAALRARAATKNMWESLRQGRTTFNEIIGPSVARMRRNLEQSTNYESRWHQRQSLIIQGHRNQLNIGGFGRILPSDRCLLIGVCGCACVWQKIAAA